MSVAINFGKIGIYNEEFPFKKHGTIIRATRRNNI